MEKNKENQDLDWQKPEESDNLQKSARPNKDYMEDRKMCSNCHGVINDHGKCTRGCK